MRRFFLSLLLMGGLLPLCAQRTKTVEAEYVYVAPVNVTVEQAKYTALERAKLQAMAEEFGTTLSQDNTTRVNNRNGESSIDFTQISGSQVRGQWIETTGEPTYDISYQGDALVVTVRVKGKAREITSAGVDFQARMLRNGTDDKFESDLFHADDDLYVSFQSPVNGYVAVYCLDDDQALCLIPYKEQTDGIYPVEAGRRYVFFSTRDAQPREKGYDLGVTVYTDRDREIDEFYIVFSPNPFAKAVDSDERAMDDSRLIMPRQLPRKKFLEWLARCQKKDLDMSVATRVITIQKN